MSVAHSLERNKEITKQHLISDLKKMGIARGDHLAVALSFKSIGFVKGGPETFVDALLETVGPEGTIMMNTHTKAFPISEIRTNYTFDCRYTPSWTGLVPETLRKRKDSIRSYHPVCSVVAIGRRAKTLTETHDANAGLYLPYSRLAEINGKYLSIGLGYNLVAIRHEPQNRAGLFDVVKLFFGVKFKDKKGKLGLYIFNQPPCRAKLPDLVRSMEKRGIVRRFRIGNTTAVLCSAREFIESLSSILIKNPQLTLCNDICCIWCREAERKMDLYSRIDNPKYFQKHLWIAKTIALINKFRVKKYRYLSFEKETSKCFSRTGRIGFLLDEFRGFLKNMYLFSREVIFRRENKIC